MCVGRQLWSNQKSLGLVICGGWKEDAIYDVLFCIFSTSLMDCHQVPSEDWKETLLFIQFYLNAWVRQVVGSIWCLCYYMVRNIFFCFISLQYKLEVVWQWRMVPPGTLIVSAHEMWEGFGSVLLALGVIFQCLAITGELVSSSLCYQSGRKCCSNGAVSSAVEGGRWDLRTEVELVAQVWVLSCCFKDSFLLQ